MLELDPRKFGHRGVYVAKRLVEELKLKVPSNAKFDHEYLVRRHIPSAAIMRRWIERLGHRIVDKFGERRLVPSKYPDLIQAKTAVAQPEEELSAVTSMKSIEVAPQPQESVTNALEDHQHASIPPPSHSHSPKASIESVKPLQPLHELVVQASEEHQVAIDLTQHHNLSPTVSIELVTPLHSPQDPHYFDLRSAFNCEQFARLGCSLVPLAIFNAD
jgi:hypothetical protein